MKRTTITLPNEIAILLELEQQRLHLSTAELIRRALSAYFQVDGTQPKRLRIASLGRSGHHDTAREAESILAREWGNASRR